MAAEAFVYGALIVSGLIAVFAAFCMLGRYLVWPSGALLFVSIACLVGYLVMDQDIPSWVYIMGGGSYLSMILCTLDQDWYY